MSQIFETCKSHSIKDINEVIFNNKFGTEATKMANMFSTFFLNVDGNFTNFEQFSAELKCINHKFTAIGIAETNTSPNLGATYKIPNYKEYYQDIQDNKKTGTGVALYIHDSINVTVIDEISECSRDIESLFVKSTNTEVQITIGVIYRPNDGNRDIFCDKLDKIFEFLPKENVYILGDYNINLLCKNIYGKYEDTFMSSGFIPLISTYTHHRPGTNKSCIDNIFTNNCNTQNVVFSGTIKDNMSHHLPIFQFSNINLKLPKSTEKHTQHYDYSNKKISSFVD